MKKCSSCGATYNDSTNFCSSCGTRLSAVYDGVERDGMEYLDVILFTLYRKSLDHTEL